MPKKGFSPPQGDGPFLWIGLALSRASAPKNARWRSPGAATKYSNIHQQYAPPHKSLDRRPENPPKLARKTLPDNFLGKLPRAGSRFRQSLANIGLIGPKWVHLWPNPRRPPSSTNVSRIWQSWADVGPTLVGIGRICPPFGRSQFNTGPTHQVLGRFARPWRPALVITPTHSEEYFSSKLGGIVGVCPKTGGE